MGSKPSIGGRRTGRLAGVVVFLLGWLALRTGHAEPPLRLNTGVGAPYIQNDRQGFLDLLIPEVFQRLGVAAEAVGYGASERAMLQANSGMDDGVAMRIRGLETQYPNLVRVEEKVIDNDFVAYSIHHRFATTGFETLKPHQVAYIVGWKVFEARLGDDYRTTLVQDAEQLFSLLARDRADLVLFERWQGNWQLARRGIAARALEPPLARTEMFMYLHRRHAHLVEPAARALRAMKADGSYQRIVRRSLTPLEPR